jgi:hypothetical protein
MTDAEFANKQEAESDGTVSAAMILAYVLHGRANSASGAFELALKLRRKAVESGEVEAYFAYKDAIRFMIARGWGRLADCSDELDPFHGGDRGPGSTTGVSDNEHYAQRAEDAAQRVAMALEAFSQMCRERESHRVAPVEAPMEP